MSLYKSRFDYMELKFLNLKNTIETLKLEVGNRWSDIKTSNTELMSIFSKIDDGDDIISEEEIISLSDAAQYIESNSNNNDILEQNEVKELQKFDFDFFKNLTLNKILSDFLYNEKTFGFEFSANKLLKYIDMLPEEDLALMITTPNSDEIIQNIYNQEALSQEDKINICKKMLTKVANYYKEQGIDTNNLLQHLSNSKIISTPDLLNIYFMDELKDLVLVNKIKNIDKLDESNINEIFQPDEGSDATITFSRLENCESNITSEEKNNLSRELIQKLVTYANSKNIQTSDIQRLITKELDSNNSIDYNRLDALATKILQRLDNKNNVNNILPNGKIDRDFKQGTSGDCWLLASIKAIALKPEGLKILNDSITTDANGNVIVNLKGVDQSYTFTQAEILMNNQMSSGDLDVRALEMAIDKYLYENKNNSFEANDLNGNLAKTAYKILLDKEGEDLEITNENIDKFNQPNFVATVYNSSNSNKTIYALNNKQENVELIDEHAYSVVRSDEKYVYIINPHDTSEELKITRENFINFFQYLECFEL